jgi:deoxyadenosine/deoxycytidine kinase
MINEKKMPSASHAPFIAFAGVMGVGKSVLAQALARAIGGKAFIEPGVEQWPIPAGEKWEDHILQLEQWVSQTNFRLFTEARQTASSGTPAIADGGLFMLAKEYMDDAACQFYYGLMRADEIEIARAQAISDWDHAPRPDLLILLETDIATWKQFLQTRGREMDANEAFIANYAGQQRIIRQAAEKFAAEKGVRLFCYVNTVGEVAEHAVRILGSANDLPAVTTWPLFNVNSPQAASPENMLWLTFEYPTMPTI